MAFNDINIIIVLFLFGSNVIKGMHIDERCNFNTFKRKWSVV